MIEPEDYDKLTDDDNPIDQLDDLDPDSYRLVIPNRYTLEDFSRETTQLDRKRAQNPDGKKPQFLGLSLPSFGKKKSTDVNPSTRGIDSDLELYGGINLEQYKTTTQAPSSFFQNQIVLSRSEHAEYIKSNSSQWHQMISKYEPDVVRASSTGAKGHAIDYSDQNGTLSSVRDDKNGSTDTKTEYTSPKFDLSNASGRYQSYATNKHIQVGQRIVPPSKQPPNDMNFSPRDAFEAQKFIISRYVFFFVFSPPQ